MSPSAEQGLGAGARGSTDRRVGGEEPLDPATGRDDGQETHDRVDEVD